MRRVILVEHPTSEAPDLPPWTKALDPEGRLVIAAIAFEDTWTVYLALDDEPLGFDIQAVAGSFALN